MKKGGFADYGDVPARACSERRGSPCARERISAIRCEGEDQFYLRLSYSGIESDQIEEGLTRMKAFLESGYRGRPREGSRLRRMKCFAVSTRRKEGGPHGTR